jgi:hypothetical protein
MATSLGNAQVSVLTQHNDQARDGLNANETLLTLSNVNTNSFGKLFSLSTDGFVYAQPLYVANLAIPGRGTHNVVYIATQHDSVYAYDADGQGLIWQDNLASLGCPSGGWICTSVPASGNPYTMDILPEVGILSTPVIDSATGTLYAVAKTQEVSGGTTNYVYRLHALDIATGNERPGSPVQIQGQVPGTGSPNIGGNLQFSPQYSNQRVGLTLVYSGSVPVIYLGFGSWGDDVNWHGWIFAYSYNGSAFSQVSVFSVTPNGTEGQAGVWMSGAGMAVDASGYLYVSTGNGAWDGTSNWGDSYLKLATPGLTIATNGYFTPSNQFTLDHADLDLSSAGVMLLPDSAGTAQHPHIMIGCGKNGTVYVLDRDNLGGFNSAGDTQIIQELPNLLGTPWDGSSYIENCNATSAYWQGHIYIGGDNDSVKMFSFSNGQLSTSPVSQSATQYQYPGATPSISANGSSNGIVWTIENSGHGGTGDNTGTHAILHAYDANNLASELYNSSLVPSDNAGVPVKFHVPTVTNGKVYVGTQSSVAVYGLFSSMPPAPAPSFNPPGGAYGTGQSVTITDSLSGATIYYTTDGSTPTTSSTVYSVPILVSSTTVLQAIAVAPGFSTSPVTKALYTIASSSIAFIQVNAATPQTPQSTVSVTYPAAQTAGDLNIVVVGWNDTTSSVSSVVDSQNNTYQLAIGPTRGGGLSQSIYYASNIKAGSNTVKVTFSQAATFPDIRVLEYTGVNKLDVTAGASGTGTTSNSGSATTTAANELIFGANDVAQVTTAAGTNFTSRIITNPDADIAEDGIVSATGSYSATAALNGGAWVMQMATFFSASSGTAPTVGTVSPNNGSTAGGTAVTITGTNFASGATVTFGGAAATNVVVVSGTQITATTPAGNAGAVTVTVTVGSQSGSLTNGFTYLTPPTVSSVSPNTGSTGGGTAVTITGTNFASGATVTFGGAAATNVVVVSATQITATTPAGSAGAVTVTVTVGSQSGSLTNGFTYAVLPTVSGVNPNSGPTAGGTAVTITGTNFASGATVTFGSAQASNVVVVSATQITATTPAGSTGAVTVTVTVSGQSGSLTNGFTYLAPPTVSSVSPNSGSTAGGTAVTITGTNFASGATVTFGGAAATNVAVVSSTQITATTPAGSAGAVVVTVTVSGQSGSLTNGFTYVVPPTVSSVSPNSGPAAGGTPVTITGTNFAPGATVTFGGAAATNVVVVSATQITATTPAGGAGAVTVTVTVSGQSGSLTNGFTYTGAPAIAFVQVAAATPQSPQSTVSVTYPAAQTLGDLNIVVVGWSDTTSSVTGVTDSQGNSYSLAIGPTRGTTHSQSLYYASNIKAGSNTVKVTFNQAATFPDIRVLEYTGVNTLDVTAAATGSGTTSNSGSATTTTANELIFAANDVAQVTTAAGTNFTSRIITSPDGDIAEDRIVSATGSYSATAALTGGTWVMQMAAFKWGSISPTAATPTFSPGAGTYSSAQSVTISSTTSGATICYTTNGTTPAATTPGTCSSGTALANGGTVAVSVSETLEAIATESGFTNSGVGSATYTISTCVQNLAIGSYTLCGEVYNDVSSGTSVTVNYSPSPNNGIIAYATWCFNSSCNSSSSGITATIGDNINATESCFVASPHSPFITDGNGGAQGSGDFQQHYVWYCPSIPSGVTSFTVTPSSPNLSYLQLNISEWKAGSLAASCSPISACFENVDNFGQAGNSTGGTTATITTSGPTVNTNDLVFAVTEVPCCSFTASPGTGYTGITVAPSVTPGMVSEAKAATVTGTQTATTTWTGGSAAWFGVIVPLKGAGAAPVAATPTFNPGPGTYSSAQSVTISSTTSGATICYTTNGTTPAATTPGTCSTGTTLANGGSVTVSTSETLEAIATESAFTNSTVATGTYTIGTGPIAFVQVAAATPQTPQSSVSVAYSSAQTAGDLNIVVVGWNDTTSSVSSVVDSQNNTYRLAIGPTRGTAISQSIYYASSIKGGSNTVTVTFSQAATFPDIRVLEYAGVSTPDVTAGASGSGSPSNSGSATTTAANELIFGANDVAQTTTGAGTNFTSRIITNPDADIAEDRIVSATGSYSATAPLTGGAWVMQMVTFK